MEPHIALLSCGLGLRAADEKSQHKTRNEALRALKRRISDAVYRQLRADAAR